MTGPSGVKLRESCESCAASKVKCSKDKPICNRCAEKGITCQYLVTQKTGRKPRRWDAKTKPTENVTPLHTTTPSLSSSSPSPPKLDLAVDVPLFDPQLGTFDPSTTLDSSLEDFMSSFPTTPYYSLPILSDQGLATYPTSMELAHGNYAAGNCALHSPHIPFPPSESPLTTSNEMGTDSLELGMASLACCFPTSELSQQIGDTDSLLASRQSLLASRQTDGLKLALRLMMQLDVDSALSASLAATVSEKPVVTPASQLQKLIDRNKKVMETVDSILKTLSHKDGYCLVIVCLIVSKVLGTYADATHPLPARPTIQRMRTSVSSGISTLSGLSATTVDSISESPTTTEKMDALAALQVLDELYQVQSSVDELSAKICLCTEQNRNFGEVIGNDKDLSLVGLTFSSTILEQLSAELRRRLSTLSLGLIDKMKQYWA